MLMLSTMLFLKNHILILFLAIYFSWFYCIFTMFDFMLRSADFSVLVWDIPELLSESKANVGRSFSWVFSIVISMQSFLWFFLPLEDAVKRASASTSACIWWTDVVRSRHGFLTIRLFKPFKTSHPRNVIERVCSGTYFHSPQRWPKVRWDIFKTPSVKINTQKKTWCRNSAARPNQQRPAIDATIQSRAIVRGHMTNRERKKAK